MEQAGHRDSFRFIGVIPRVGAAVLGLVLLGVSAATIKIINHNDFLDKVREVDTDKYEVRNSPYYDDIVDLQSLIFGSLSAAGWLMFMAGGILIAEGIAIILVIYGLQSTWKMVFTVMEITFSIGVIVCYLCTGIACAFYASKWSDPPKLCALFDEYDKDKDICDSTQLTVTDALKSGFCFLQIGMFGFIIIMTVMSMLKSRAQKGRHTMLINATTL